MNWGSFVDMSKRAMVLLEGAESLDLLQRISTNDVATLALGGAIQTVLTNEKGRIVELVTVLRRGQNEVLVVGHSEDPLIIKDWIEKYIIMEDIKVKVISANFIHLMAYDTTTNIKTAKLRLVSPDCTILEETLSEVVLTHVLVPKALGDATINVLSEGGLAKRNRQHFEEYRILNGIPAFPTELSTLYNPLEAGLLHFVSFTKGCYIGQEVVARLDTYKKVQRQLVRMKMEDLPPELPEKVYFEGKEWGTITSALRLSGSRECRGLGYIKVGSEVSGARLYFLKGSEEINLTVDLLGSHNA